MGLIVENDAMKNQVVEIVENADNKVVEQQGSVVEERYFVLKFMLVLVRRTEEK